MNYKRDIRTRIIEILSKPKFFMFYSQTTGSPTIAHLRWTFKSEIWESLGYNCLVPEVANALEELLEEGVIETYKSNSYKLTDLV